MREGSQEEVEANLRSPKNRFLLVFCPANQVDDHWGNNWTFQCGVIMFAIIIGIWTIFDIVTLTRLMGDKAVGEWFTFWCAIRFISDLLAITSVVMSLISLSQINFKLATVAYYVLFASLILNFVFFVYCITCIFDADFWKATTYQIIFWMLNEFVLVICDWILFCNMVDIGRKSRAPMSNTV